jgi:hypothetical protein
MNPRYPVFIPSKGRAETRMTVRGFDNIGVPYTVFVEPQQYDEYAAVIDPSRLHVLPHSDKGVTVTRNYIWDYAERIGAERYWTFDDNILGAGCTPLFRFNHNLKVPCADGTTLAVMEDFCDRYDNVAIAGPNYFMFAKRKSKIPPYTLNTRVYSAMLIKTKIEKQGGGFMRWETFFNEDTDLCLRVLKAGYCTVLFNAFLIYKQTTMTMKGGNSDYYAATEKRREFVEELVRKHPDCVELTEKWGRWHHHVNYSVFKQQLRRKEGVSVSSGVNNYGMVLEEKIGEAWREIPA